MYTTFLLSLLGLAISQLPSGNSLDLQTFPPTKLQKNQAFLDTLESDYPHLEDELRNAQDALQKLWTVYLPELWQSKSKQLSQECENSVLNLIPGLRENSSSDLPVSLQMVPLLDATGKQGAGLLTGNSILDGSSDQCFSYNYTGYCLAYFVTVTNLPPTPPFLWTVGLCVPKYCTNRDVAMLIDSTMLLKVEEAAIACENSKTPSYSTGAVVMLAVTAMMMAMVVAGSVVDVIFSQFMPFFFGQSKVNETLYVVIVSANQSKDTAASENVPLIDTPTDANVPKIKVWDFITAFSLFKTVPTLLATKQAPSVITSLNGLRVISMFWVILGHTHLWTIVFGGPGMDNPTSFEQVSSRFSFQPVINGLFSVDTFFFISGVLVAYLTLREMKKRKGRFPFLHFYIHRYLRLTPTYAFVLFFSWTLTNHLARSPIVSMNGNLVVGDCGKYWWTNLLYINNLYPWRQEEECFSWSWYLANDMQFYVISPLILIPAYYIFPVALIIISVLLVCSFVVTATLVGVFDLQLSNYAELAYNYTGPSTAGEYNDLVYVKPWSRIPPYLVGLVLGYLLYREVRLPFGRKKNALLYLLFWIIAGAILIPDLYGLYFTWHGHTPSKFENIIYVSLSRFAWGVGLALVVFATHAGYGWIINSFLSMKMWTPLSRMTFNAYLVHPIVLTVVFGQFEKSIHYTDITMAFYAVGIVVFSYGVAGVICLVVEFPLGTIEMLVFKMVAMKGRKRPKEEVVMNGQEIGGKKDDYKQTEV